MGVLSAHRTTTDGIHYMTHIRFGLIVLVDETQQVVELLPKRLQAQTSKV